MVLAARAAGISASIASTTPQRMPMSRLPLSDWLGSSTSPPLITRSNLSFGPMAALALADSAAAAAEPVSSRKRRRDNADMALPPNFVFCEQMMRRRPAFRKLPLTASAYLRRNRNARVRWPQGSGAMRNTHRHWSRLALTIPVFLTLAPCASASTATETASKWGLIGRWSLDCSLPPDRDRGAVLIYAIARGGRLTFRRDFGDEKDDNEVVGVKVSADGMLNLRVYFPSLKPTREYGLMMQPDGTI